MNRTSAKLPRILSLILVLVLLEIGGPGASCMKMSLHVPLCEASRIDEIDCKLYLGNSKAAADQKLLQTLKISHILTIDSEPLPRKVLLNQMNITNLYIQAHDTPDQRLDPYLSTTNAFIKEGVNQGGILVHSQRGASRSVALVVAYFMERHRMGYEDALEYVRARIPAADPNPGFEQQLKEYCFCEENQLVFESCEGSGRFVYVWLAIIFAFVVAIIT